MKIQQSINNFCKIIFPFAKNNILTWQVYVRTLDRASELWANYPLIFFFKYVLAYAKEQYIKIKKV